MKLEKKTENKALEFFDLSFLSPSTLYKTPSLKQLKPEKPIIEAEELLKRKEKLNALIAT